MSGKRSPALEMPEDEPDLPSTPRPPTTPPFASPPTLAASTRPTSIPLPPIPAAPRREIMVQLSIKAPLALVERLEVMTKDTGAQKQAVMAAALDAYLSGHGY